MIGGSVSAFPFPVLSESSLCYVEGVSYEASIERKDEKDDITVEHRLRGDSLVATLINEKRAKFACVVSAPLTMHRKVHPLETDSQGNAWATQRISCNEGELSGIPRLRPIVVCTENIPPVLVRASHGLDRVFYSGEHVEFPDGTIIADAGWMKFGGHRGLFQVECDANLPNGTVKVTESMTDGFYFVVSVHPEMYAIMQDERENSECKNIMIGALTDALSALQNGDLREEWQDHQTLQALHRDLVAHGLVTWEDKDFRPLLAASTIRPFALTADQGVDDD